MREKRGNQPTSKRLGELLSDVLKTLGERCKERPDQVLAYWPEVIGSRFASMTKAVSFKEGVLTVKVNNSTLLSLLSQHEKVRLLHRFKEKFPQSAFRNIVFRSG